MNDLIDKVKENLILCHNEDDELLMGYINAAIMLIDEVLSVGDAKFKKKSYQKMKAGYYLKNSMSQTTEQAVIMLATHFYESRDGSTAGFWGDNVQASEQVWSTVKRLLQLDKDWQV